MKAIINSYIYKYIYYIFLLVPYFNKLNKESYIRKLVPIYIYIFKC